MGQGPPDCEGRSPRPVWYCICRKRRGARPEWIKPVGPGGGRRATAPMDVRTRERERERERERTGSKHRRGSPFGAELVGGGGGVSFRTWAPKHRAVAAVLEAGPGAG